VRQVEQQQQLDEQKQQLDDIKDVYHDHVTATAANSKCADEQLEQVCCDLRMLLAMCGQKQEAETTVLQQHMSRNNSVTTAFEQQQ